jgi:hypothetical protein
MPRAGDPRHPVDVEADVVAAHQSPIAGVDAHPHTNRHTRRPGVGFEPPLRLDARAQRGRCLSKREESRVTFGRDLRATGGRARVAEYPIVIVQDRRVAIAQRLERARRALDVAHEERDRSRGQCRRGCGRSRGRVRHRGLRYPAAKRGERCSATRTHAAPFAGSGANWGARRRGLGVFPGTGAGDDVAACRWMPGPMDARDAPRDFTRQKDGQPRGRAHLGK